MRNYRQKTTPKEQKTATEEQEIELIREWLPKTNDKSRAYIKGAIKALLYAQEEPENITTTAL